MPSLRTLSEGTETLSLLSEGTETLATISEATETLSALSELTNDIITTLGFFPSLSVYQTANSEHAAPSLTNYPGNTYSTAPTGRALTALGEATETLTPLAEI